MGNGSKKEGHHERNGQDTSQRTEHGIGKAPRRRTALQRWKLDGLKLIGFSVWSRQDGKRLVTFPARQFTVDGERRSFSLLRAVENPSAQTRLRDFVMQAYLADVQEIEGVTTS